MNQLFYNLNHLQYLKQRYCKNLMTNFKTKKDHQVQNFINNQFYFKNSNTDKPLKVNVCVHENIMSIQDILLKQSITLQLNSLLIQVILKEKTKAKIGFKIWYKSGVICLFSKNQDIIETWIKILQTNIISTGFYQLYSPIEKIGKGAFATVFKAIRKIDGKMVAVKTFKKMEIIKQPIQLAALFNQIQLIKNLDHQNLLKFEAVYQTRKQICIVMELLEGVSLQSKLQHQDLSKEQTKLFMNALLHALVYLDQKKIVHRDLKPSNVMMRDKSFQHPVIVDFGLGTREDSAKQLFSWCGTIGYIAPETYSTGRHRDKISTKCDIFSVGAIFHLLLTKFQLFQGNANEVNEKNKYADFNLKSKTYKDIDPKAMDLLQKMLQVSPKKRISAKQALKHEYFGSCLRSEATFQQ